MPIFVPAIGDSKKGILQLAGDRPARSRTYGDLVHRPDGRDFSCRAGKENRVCNLYALAWNGPLLHPHTQSSGQFDCSMACDTRQYREARGRRVDSPVFHNEQILAAALADDAVDVEDDALAGRCSGVSCTV